MDYVHVDYAKVSDTSGWMRAYAVSSLTETTGAGFDSLSLLLGESQGDYADALKAQFVKEKELALKLAELFTGVADLLDSVAAELKKTDAAYAQNQVSS